MLTLVREFAVTIPAGTAKATPQVTPTTFDDMVIDRIEWYFPQGSAGVVGVQIGARSVQVLPTNTGTYFVRSGDSTGFDVTDLPTTGDWSVIGYNTGLFPHTVYVTFTGKPPASEPPLVFIIDGSPLADQLGES